MVYKDLKSLLIDYPQKDLGRSNDLTGKKVNHVTFICRVQGSNNRLAYWALKCDCGNYFVARAYSILQNNTTSCGCAQTKTRYLTNHIKDLTNQQFGLLTVKKFVGKDKYGNAIWQCECTCGNITAVRACNLKSGGTSSCGKCHRKESSYELKIKKWLDEHKFYYECEYKVKELKNQRFDFKVNLANKTYILIEMQGEQHFRPISCFGGEDKFKIQVQHDLQKKQYCENNNIPFLIIRYDEDIEQKLAQALLF